MNCHVGCTPQEIVSELGLTMKDIFPEKSQAKTKITQYRYTDEIGMNPVYKVRFSDKSFRWEQWDSLKGWVYSRKGIKPMLYNMENLKAANPVYLVEGEKDVETLMSHGLTAASPPDGAKSKWYPHYTEILTGKDIIIIPDNDSPGKELARTEANELAGKANSVKIISLTDEWPGLPEKGDISDVFQMDKPEDV